MEQKNILMFCSLVFALLIFSSCSEPVKIEDIDNNIATVKGKYFILKGKVKKNHDLLINGMNVNLNPDKTFKKNLKINFGENRYKLEIAPKNRAKDSFFREIIIKREMYPCEIEYMKSANHTPIHFGDTDDFSIDQNEIYLATVYGHGSPTIYDLKKGCLLKKMSKPEGTLGYSQSVTFTPDNKFILVGLYKRNTIHVIDCKNFNYSQLFYVRGGKHFSTSHKTNTIITSSEGIWKIDPNNFNVIGYYQPRYVIDIIAIDPSGTYVASETSYVYDSGTIKITDTKKYYTHDSQNWEHDELKISKKTKVAEGELTAITWDKTGEKIISGTEEGEVVISTLNKDKTLKVIKKTKLDSKITSISLDRDNSKLIVGTQYNISILSYPSLQSKIIYENGAKKILNSINNDIFYYNNEAGVFKASTNNINWELIKQYYEMKNNDKI